ncbi:hypothetical protein AgCh_027056 [Apium graveolens]
MGSREKDPTMPHQPLLSSLVVRPTDSDGGGGGSDYEPGEVRPGPPPYSRSDQFADGSASPGRRRTTERRYSPEFDHPNGPPRSHGFGRGRDPPRYRDHSPPYGHMREGGRFNGRGLGPGPFRGDDLPRNSPNVRPREGDWVCPDPRCNNLNFARRESCNKCKRPRYDLARSPRRGYAGFPPPFARRYPGPGPALDRYPGRPMGGYRSPPRSWARGGPREFGLGPPRRREGRFPDQQMRRDHPDYLEDRFRDRPRFERPIPLDWERERERDTILSDRKGYERRPLSPHEPPALLPPRGHWPHDMRDRSLTPVRDLPPPRPHDVRERSRSPVRDLPLLRPHDVRERSRSPVRDLPSLKNYRRDIYMERDRDDRRPMGRDRVGDAY